MDDVMNHFDINLICFTANRDRRGIHSQFAGWMNNKMRITCVVELLSVGCIGVYYLFMRCSLLVQGDSLAHHCFFFFFFALLVKYKEVIHLKRFIDPFIVCMILRSRIITHVVAGPGNCSVPLRVPFVCEFYICTEQWISYVRTIATTHLYRTNQSTRFRSENEVRPPVHRIFGCRGVWMCLIGVITRSNDRHQVIFPKNEFDGSIPAQAKPNNGP